MNSYNYLLLLFYFNVNYIHCQVWFEKLPDASLKGVPKIIVDNENNYKVWKNLLLTHFGRKKKLEVNFRNSSHFLCPVNGTRSEVKPSSVHTLRPGDIDIVSALGDSMTAANGNLAQNIFQVLIENRGTSPFIGGEETWNTVLTLPNILKEFNPGLIGYSLKDSYSHHPASGFNMAEAGAMSQDLPFMVKQLVKKIRKDSRVDFQNDWKLVTLLIGANNFCIDNCYLQNASHSIEAHRKDLIKTFSYLMQSMPRTLVVFLQTLNIKALLEVEGFPDRCKMNHLFECSCFFARQHQPKKQDYLRIVQEWQRIDEEVASDNQFREKEDFAIVLIPFTKTVEVPRKLDPKTGKTIHDTTLFSHDCFHLNHRGNAKIAQALWNSLLQREGNKTKDWFEAINQLLCPTKDSPYIYTWKNSIN